MADIIIDGTNGANRLLILDSTGKIPAVDGSQLTNFAAGNIATGTIPIARIDTGTTANKIVKLDGNAKLPAVDGSQITNMPSATKSSNNPTISTNPSGGVGSEWHNTSTGEAYICTDATAGANVWTNIGEGTGDIQPWVYGGTQYGYQSGGYPNNNTINKFSFASATANATGDYDLTVARHAPCGNSSKLFGYVCGGNSGSPTNVIDKFSFTTDGNAVDHGDLTVSRSYPSEPGQTSSTHGFTSGGYGSNPISTIDKFAFDADGNATDHGDLSTARTNSYGQSSSTHGYSVHDAIMDKFSFASNTTAVDVGAASLATRRTGAGQSSETHGYACGQEPGNNVIDKFAFATEGTMTDVGDLTVNHSNCCGQSSLTYGYVSGGDSNNVIERHSFASDGNAADVGDLVHSIGYVGGSHY